MTTPLLILAFLLGGTVLTPPSSASTLARAASSSSADALELLAAYRTIQFASARDLQRQLISERRRHVTAVHHLRRTHRTSANALRRRILALGVDMTGAAPSRTLPIILAKAGRVESAPIKVPDASAASWPTGGGLSIGYPRHEPSRLESDGAARTLLQEASLAEPSCSMDELMAVQADPTAAVTGLFTTNPSCASCLVLCGSAADAVSCGMGCLKKARPCHHCQRCLPCAHHHLWRAQTRPHRSPPATFRPEPPSSPVPRRRSSAY
jgi:hypothetical protein